MACHFTVPPLQVAAVETDGLRTEARPRALRLKDFGAGPGQYHVAAIGSDLPPLGSNLSAPLDAPSLDLGSIPQQARAFTTTTRPGAAAAVLPSGVPKLSYSTGLQPPAPLNVGAIPPRNLLLTQHATSTTRVAKHSSPVLASTYAAQRPRGMVQQAPAQVISNPVMVSGPPPTTKPGFGAATNHIVTTTASAVVSNKEDKLMSLKYNFQGGDFSINGENLTLQALHPTDQGETGWRVWDAGIVLSKFAEQNFVGKQLKVLELGCGTGISGISFALCGSEVILSDKEVIRSRTETNIELNQNAITKHGGSCRFMSLDWNDLHLEGLPKDIDMIISSDVIWADVFVQPFLETVRKVCEYLDNVPVILFSHKTRVESVDKLFFAQLPNYGFVVSDTITSEEVCSEEFQHPKIKIYCFEERSK